MIEAPAAVVLAEPKDAARVKSEHFETLLGFSVASGSVAKDARVSARLIWTDGRLPQSNFRKERGGPAIWWLADGFLRSGGVGRSDPSLSLLVDRQRSHDDCHGPSDLESCIRRTLDDKEVQRSRHLIQAWRHGHISKWNHYRDVLRPLPKRYILVIDQERHDPTIERADANRGNFKRMLRAAVSENPGAALVVWRPTHDRFPWMSRGSVPIFGYGSSRPVIRLNDQIHPARILEQAEVVYTVSSHLGFEALIWGKRVRTFGMPFYAAWSLTEDEVTAPPATRCPASIEQLVHGALVDYARYVDPETGRRCEVERIIEHLSLQRRMQERFPPVIHAVGFQDPDASWKRPIVQKFFQGSRIRFVRGTSSWFSPDALIAIWGAGPRSDRGDENRPVWHIEDGFLRSVGLGAQLVSPLSWVVDRRGIYYDPSRASDLERILETSEIDDDLCRRAARLRQRIAGAGITKYNLGSARWRRPTSRRVILVPGQVESDLSIVYGAQSIRTNSGLLSAVRAENPEAYVVFKPHPDVLAGLRKGDAASLGDAACDEIVGSEVGMGGILGEVDEVHTMTSLAGFEALLRNKRVVAYGIPFYSGWGLTDDKAITPRRTRRLTLDMLTAGALILYPTYVSRVTGRYTSPERVLVEIEEWRSSLTTSA